MPMRIVIVGAGVTGVTAARAIREHCVDCEIDLYTREPYPYYYRPRLPELLAGSVELPQIIAYPDSWYAERKLRLHLSTPVASIDAGRKVAVLEDGSEVPFDRLLIASGSDPFVPPIEGAARPGVFTLRTADDALAIREYAGGARRAVVVGCGLLGLESARGLSKAGLEVTVLETAGRLLPRQLDEKGAAFLEAEVRRLGLVVMKNAKSVRIEGDGRPSGVRLDDGTLVPGELVLFAAGVRSTTAFLDAAGLTIERGIVVDCGMTTSLPDVYAAGDVAQFEGTVWGIIPVAIAQATAAAESMTDTGGERHCAVTPHNTLKITGVDVFSAGDIACDGPSCVEHILSDQDARIYRKVVVRDGKPVGAIVVGSRKGVSELNAAIQAGVDVGDFGDDIARDDFDFKRLSPQSD
jgi:nitrite reductase (NADH) large subunit